MASQSLINALSTASADRRVETTPSASTSDSSQVTDDAQASWFGAQFVHRAEDDVDMRGNTVANLNTLISVVSSKAAVDDAYRASLREALIERSQAIAHIVPHLQQADTDIGAIAPPTTPQAYTDYLNRPALPAVPAQSTVAAKLSLSRKLPEVSLRCHSLVCSLARNHDLSLYRELTR